MIIVHAPRAVSRQILGQMGLCGCSGRRGDEAFMGWAGAGWPFRQQAVELAWRDLVQGRLLFEHTLGIAGEDELPIEARAAAMGYMVYYWRDGQ